MNLIQKSLFSGNIKFELLESKVRVHNSRLGHSQTHSFEYHVLDDDFEAYSSVPYKYLLWMVPFLSLQWLIAPDVMAGTEGALVAAVMLALAALFFVYLFIKHCAKLTMIKSRHTGAILFSVRNSKPDAGQFEQFIATLKSKIKASTGTQKLTADEKLHIYERHINFLFEEGVLTQDEAVNIFTRAEERLTKKQPNLYSISGKNDNDH